MTVRDKQVRKLKMEYEKTGQIEKASLRAGMCRKTGSQDHKAGKRLSTDFTSMKSVGITIGGQPFDHMLCHCVLTYSNWQWVTIAHSESFLAIKKGVQAVLSRLGYVPSEHWTDNSTAATHRINASEKHRKFNDNYKSLMNHFGITPKTTQLASPNENGDVESLHTLQERGATPRWNTVLEFCPRPRISIPEMKSPAVCLASYDALLQGRAQS